MDLDTWYMTIRFSYFLGVHFWKCCKKKSSNFLIFCNITFFRCEIETLLLLVLCKVQIERFLAAAFTALNIALQCRCTIIDFIEYALNIFMIMMFQIMMRVTVSDFNMNGNFTRFFLSKTRLRSSNRTEKRKNMHSRTNKTVVSQKIKKKRSIIFSVALCFQVNENDTFTAGRKPTLVQ